MRILLVNIMYPTPQVPLVYGGTEIVVQRLAEALIRAGHQVLCIRGAPPGSSLPDETASGVRVLSVPLKNLYWPYGREEHHASKKLLWHLIDDLGASHPRIPEAVREFAPDVVHTNSLQGLSTSVLRQVREAGVPIVHTLHDYYMTCPRSARFRNGARCVMTCTECRLLSQRRRMDASLIDAVVGVSNAVLKVHDELGLFQNTRIRDVIFNIVPPISVPPRGIPDPVVFGFLGRITESKGVDVLVRAFARMTKSARLVIGGRVSDDEMARLQAAAKPRQIDFLGFVTPQEFFAAVDVLVVPSIWDEALGMVTLEGQAAGRPTIGAAIGGIPEAIGGDRAGWTFEPGSVEALSQLMDRVAEQPDAILEKAKAASSLTSRCDEQAVVAKYIEIYSRAMGLAKQPVL
jgi:glycosyltransferase involved in cell wall biosynthesis